MNNNNNDFYQQTCPVGHDLLMYEDKQNNCKGELVLKVT